MSTGYKLSEYKMMGYTNLFNGLSGRADIDRADVGFASSERWHLFLEQSQANGDKNFCEL